MFKSRLGSFQDPAIELRPGATQPILSGFHGKYRVIAERRCWRALLNSLRQPPTLPKVRIFGTLHFSRVWTNTSARRKSSNPLDASGASLPIRMPATLNSAKTFARNVRFAEPRQRRNPGRKDAARSAGETAYGARASLRARTRWPSRRPHPRTDRNGASGTMC